MMTRVPLDFTSYGNVAPEAAVACTLEPDIRDAWLAAMRSGDYRKADGTLRNTSDEFCALGVLGDLHPDLQWVESTKADATYWVLVDKGADDPDNDEARGTGMLPWTFLQRYGITRNAADLIAALNDTDVYDQIRYSRYSSHQLLPGDKVQLLIKTGTASQAVVDVTTAYQRPDNSRLTLPEIADTVDGNNLFA